MLLSRLSINNLAIIGHLDFIPRDGLNILTGETGSGKSVIIRSLDILTGAKTDLSLIRTGCRKLKVTGEFTSVPDNILEFLRGEGIRCSREKLILSREFSDTNRSRGTINSVPVKIDKLKEAGSMIIDIHGQHEHRSLADPENHTGYLDMYLGIDISTAAELFNESLTLKRKLKELKASEKKLKDRKELLEYQIKEIDAVAPEDGEDVTVGKELKILENVGEIKRIADRIDSISADQTSGAIGSIEELRRKCSEISVFNSELEPFAQDLESASAAVNEFNNSVSVYADSLEFDEERYEYLSSRYSELSKIMKKFGPDLSTVLLYYEKAKRDLDTIGNVSLDLKNLKDKLVRTEEELKKECERISRERRKGAERLVSELHREFAETGLENAGIEIRFQYKEPSGDGIDKAEMFLSTNTGEKMKPLSKIASGGEMSRIMLSLKNLISSSRSVNILIFDEIDSGISGKTAEKVGRKLLELSLNRQVLVVTHLPAIASKGKNHYSVRKKVAEGRAKVEVLKLNEEERKNELRSLIGNLSKKDIE